MKSIQHLIYNAVEELHATYASSELLIHHDYSGRGMFGATCFAVSGPSHHIKRVLARLVINSTKLSMVEGIAHEQVAAYEQLAESWLTQAHYDSLGHDQIVYWSTLHLTFPPSAPR